MLLKERVNELILIDIEIYDIINCLNCKLSLCDTCFVPIYYISCNDPINLYLFLNLLSINSYDNLFATNSNQKGFNNIPSANKHINDVRIFLSRQALFPFNVKCLILCDLVHSGKHVYFFHRMQIVQKDILIFKCQS